MTGVWQRRLIATASLLLIAWVPSLALAGSNFLGSEIQGSAAYPAIASIGVDIPTTYDALNKEFVFDGVVDFTFDVTGDMTIWRSGAMDSFTDPIDGQNYGADSDGYNTMLLEMVGLNPDSISASPGAVINDIDVGDGLGNGTNDGPLFSTGGAVELAPDGSIADAYLNLFLTIDVAQPLIVVPSTVQAQLGLDETYVIGPLSNQDVLRLDASIDEFPPVGIPFTQSGAPVDFYAPSSHPFVQDLANAPAPFTRPASDMVFARFITTEITIVPEPATLALLALGSLSLLRRSRTR